jgi:hypothetical protein
MVRYTAVERIAFRHLRPETCHVISGYASNEAIPRQDEDMDEPEAELIPIAEEAQRLRASWRQSSVEPSPLTPTPPRRIGWLAVWITAGTVMLLAFWLAADSTGGDPHDPGWADIAFFISPILAIAAATAVGLVLVFVAGMRLIGVKVGRAGKALAFGFVGGPVIYLVVLIAGASALDKAESTVVLALFVCVFPALCGIGATLIAAVVPRSAT